jgi:3-dehydroquinate synthetase
LIKIKSYINTRHASYHHKQANIGYGLSANHSEAVSINIICTDETSNSIGLMSSLKLLVDYTNAFVDYAILVCIQNHVKAKPDYQSYFECILVA